MIDFTAIAVSFIGGLMTIAGSLFLVWLQGHMKDQAAALVIGNAVQNALGAVKQAADAGLAAHPLQLVVPGLAAPNAAGVQYVLDNAGPELKRFAGITPETIAEKIDAKIGLGKLADATAALAATAVVAIPAAGLPVGP